MHLFAGDSRAREVATEISVRCNEGWGEGGGGERGGAPTQTPLFREQCCVSGFLVPAQGEHERYASTLHYAKSQVGNDIRGSLHLPMTCQRGICMTVHVRSLYYRKFGITEEKKKQSSETLLFTGFS